VGLSRPRSLGPALVLLCALARPAASGALAALPPRVDRARLQALLQSFVDRTYLKAFRHLGDERDFDHGHFLYKADGEDSGPVAILYHTQELALYAAPRSGYGWLDPEGRNWVQWLSDGRVENARRYRRASFGPAVLAELAALERHHTILADMLDPAAFGARVLRARQVVFTRTACGAARDDRLAILLPRSGRVCLALSEY
jgi:hypothetical protein